MRGPTAAFAVLAAAVLASCGESTVDSGDAERFVRDTVAEQTGARVSAVACPERIEQEEGATFTCRVTGADGSRGVARVTQRAGGGLSVSAPFLHPRVAEQVVAERLGERLEADGVEVDCPEIVVARKGERFTCKATAAGRTRDVDARLTDDAGAFTFRPS